MWVIEVTLNSAITLIVLTILSILFQMIILAGEREKQMIYARTRGRIGTNISMQLFIFLVWPVSIVISINIQEEGVGEGL